MKIVVIGNPPYQMNDGGGNNRSAKPIYHLFIEAIIDCISPDYLTFIVPSRWMVGGKGLDKFRNRMMNDTRMKKIFHFGGERSVFETVQIAGGVNYFLWDKAHDGGCEFSDSVSTVVRKLNKYDIILQDNGAISILGKVMGQESIYLNQIISVRNPFGIRSNYVDFIESGVKCISRFKKENYVAPDSFTDKNEYIDNWKVAISCMDGGGPSRVIGIPFIINPGSICTETYLVVYGLNTKGEAENLITYINTKFFRFMVGLRGTSQNISRDCYKFVPDLEDYSMPWTDKKLYEKYGLTSHEIAYIESKIRSRD